MPVIRFIRSCVRLALIILWLPIIGVVSFCVHIGGWNAVKRVSYCTRIWGRGVTWLWGIRTKVIGSAEGFSGGLIVSNHTGYLDILVEASLFPIRFAPKQEIRSWPLLGWYLGISRPVWVDRRNRTKSRAILEEFQATMQHGIPLLVYPEGTSSDGEHGLLPFKSTPFEAVCETRNPILPVLLKYKIGDDGETLAWYGDAELLPHVWRSLADKRIEVEVHILPVILPQPNEDRKELAERVYRIMSDAYAKIGPVGEPTQKIGS